MSAVIYAIMHAAWTGCVAAGSVLAAAIALSGASLIVLWAAATMRRTLRPWVVAARDVLRDKAAAALRRLPFRQAQLAAAWLDPPVGGWCRECWAERRDECPDPAREVAGFTADEERRLDQLAAFYYPREEDTRWTP